MSRDITNRFPGFESFRTFGCYYPVRTGDDRLSQSVLRLKDGDQDSINKWGNYINASMKYTGLHLVRALGHDELSANGNRPLDKLGQLIVENEKHTVALWNKHLSKNRETESLKTLGRDERREELDNVFSFVLHSKPEIRNRELGFLIYDDIVTTGTTIKAIASAIRQSWPNAKFYGFSLLETYDSWAPQSHDNDAIYNQFFASSVDEDEEDLPF